jgi:glucose-6-phosphate 1-dehydrogenase
MSSSFERSSDSKQTPLILGASGDLAARLLLPGLGGLLASGGGEDISLVGSDVEDWDDKRWREGVAESLAAGGAGGDSVDAVAGSTRYVQADATAQSDLRRLLDACDGRVVAYFALPLAIAERASKALTGHPLEMLGDGLAALDPGGCPDPNAGRAGLRDRPRQQDERA